MPNPLILKLEHGADLTDADQAMLDKISARPFRVEPRQDLIREGDRPDDIHLVLSGFACRYKVLPGGDRQIMALLVPGDFCDLHVALLGEMDHTISTLSACTIVRIPHSTILEMTSTHPRITRALWWASLVDESILREGLVNLGKREADRRAAHLFCELLVRLQVVGLADETGYSLPMTQQDLADLLGLSVVHMNRTLRSLREAGLVELTSKRLTLPDVERLIDFAEFTPNYLHLTRRATQRRPAASVASQESDQFM